MISQGFNSRACGYVSHLGEDFTLLREILRAVILTVKHRSNGRLLKKISEARRAKIDERRRTLLVR
jgi:hypothetical protein